MDKTLPQNGKFVFEYTIPLIDRFDLGLCVSSGQVFRWTFDGDTWFGVEGEHWFLVRPVTDRLEITSTAPQTHFESLFRLDWNAAEIEREIVRLAPEMEPYLQGFPGLRVMRPSCPVEAFFSFLCTPNNNVARITSMVRKLAEYGEPLPVQPPGHTLIRRFPTTLRIAQIPEQELREKGFGYRAQTIPSIARQALERGEDWVETLGKKPYGEIHQLLVELKGVGPKLADCIALFAYDKTESAPMDTHLWQAMTRLYFPEWRDKALTDQRYKTAADFLREKFGPLTGWAHQYLFYDNMKRKSK